MEKRSEAEKIRVAYYQHLDTIRAKCESGEYHFEYDDLLYFLLQRINERSFSGEFHPQFKLDENSREVLSEWLEFVTTEQRVGYNIIRALGKFNTLPWEA